MIQTSKNPFHLFNSLSIIFDHRDSQRFLLFIFNSFGSSRFARRFIRVHFFGFVMRN
ncbi:hypothetical protein HanPSC8_Chr08g0338151 [Helianthus annuus]|nr:hypothetical protein HanPSC8_Chr08g0338151 [Helianthus annuus]